MKHYYKVIRTTILTVEANIADLDDAPPNGGLAFNYVEGLLYHDNDNAKIVQLEPDKYGCSFYVGPADDPGTLKYLNIDPLC